MVPKWLGFSGVLFAGKNSYCRVTAKNFRISRSIDRPSRNLGTKGVEVNNSFVKKYEKLLAGGI
jgi:hypothetical protein